MKEIEKYSERKKYLILLGFICLSIIIGFFFDSKESILEGMKKLILHHNLIDTDAFYIGGIGASFVNAGLCMLIAIGFFLLTSTKLGSGELTGLMMVYGYAFYGKNIHNIIPIMFGTYFYGFVMREKLSIHSPTACFATCIGPVVSLLSFHNEILVRSSLTAHIVAILIGILSGFLVAYFTDHMRSLLKGRSMLLGGFTAGVVAVLIYGLLKAVGLGHGPYESTPTVDQIYRLKLSLSLALLFIYLILASRLNLREIKDTLGLLFKDKPESDYVGKHGFRASITSIGFMGLIGLAYFLLVPGSKMHGEMYAGIFTIAAFSVKGLTPRYMLPFVIGMVGGNFVTASTKAALHGEHFIRIGLERISSRGIMMGTYLGSGMAPLVDEFGVFHTIFMGLIYGLITPNIASLHGGIMDYNSGFALGLVVVLFSGTETLIRRKNQDRKNNDKNTR